MRTIRSFGLCRRGLQCRNQVRPRVQAGVATLARFCCVIVRSARKRAAMKQAAKNRQPIAEFFHIRHACGHSAYWSSADYAIRTAPFPCPWCGAEVGTGVSVVTMTPEMIERENSGQVFMAGRFLASPKHDFEHAHALRRASEPTCTHYRSTVERRPTKL